MAMRNMASQAAVALRVRCCPASRLAGLPFSMSRAMSTIIDDLKYSKSHEWVKVEGDDVALIGITDHAQHALGDIVFTEIRGGVGDSITATEPFASVESVKAVSDVNAPVSGKIVELNSALTDEPGLVNGSPYNDGWFAKVKLTNPSELGSLLDSKAYKVHVDSEEH